MTVSAASVDLSTADDGTTGLVELSATYEGLAAVEDGRLTVAEPFASGFETDYRFTLRGPDGYRLADAAPEPAAVEDGRATWAAGSDLSGFEATFVPESGAAAENSDGTSGTDGTTGDASSGDGPGLGPVAVLAALAVATAGLVARRRT
ncbi:hypothetical protein BRC93_09425 [Halobacteriales archaeon QS_5_70_15]|nr:MAG: hypothetical protein BRC93_09425 [Halobacteriales archaeon QS_5_70_15]